VVRRVYERYGFEPLETPAFENIETLLGKYGEEGNKLIFKILKRGEHEQRGEADLALRYDLTVPLARVIAQYQNDLPKFFKRYQIQPVWRADRPARGRFREFYQCDIDSIGSTSPLVEAEQIAAVSEILGLLGFDDFLVHLNHRGVLLGLLQAANISADKSGTALVALDKFDKVGEEGVASEFAARGIAPESAHRLIGMLRTMYGVGVSLEANAELEHEKNRAKFDSMKDLLQTDVAHAALHQLQVITELASQTQARRHICIDPRLARGLSYYTGAIMEISVPDLAGSLGGGGRYDNLVGMFLGRDVPACGFSLGLERIIVVMTERAMFPADVVGSTVDVMVALWNEGARADALALASELRRADLRVDIYPEADKPGKQFKYAASRNVPFVAIVGDDERAQGTVSIKDLRTGDQQTIARGEAGQYVATRRQS
jgi:histidyl-tRNA synthetase